MWTISHERGSKKDGATAIQLVVSVALCAALTAGCLDEAKRPTSLAAAPVSLTFPKGDLAMALGLALSEDGGFVVVGRAETVAGPSSWGWTAKVSREGMLLWDRDWRSLGDLSALFAVMTVGDGVVAVGDLLAARGGGRVAQGLVMKIDREGALGWTRKLDLGGMTQISAVVEDGSGGAMIGGVVSGKVIKAPFVARTTASGKIIQRTSLDGESDWVLRLRRVGDQGYLMIASDLVRLDPAGRPLWRQRGVFRDATALRDGSVVAIRADDDHDEIVRFSASGAPVWEKRPDQAMACAAIGVWTRAADEIVVASSPCPDSGSELASLAVLSPSGENRVVHHIRVGSAVAATVAMPGPSGEILLAGLADEKKGWVFRSGPVLGPSR